MPKWKAAKETRRPRGIPVGKVTQQALELKNGPLAGGKRDLWLYQPPTGRAVPLLLVWDGPVYLKRGMLARIADHLIAEGRIEPVAMLLIQHGGRWNARGIEYHTSEATVALAENVLLPFARERLNLIDEKAMPGVHGVIGASMGGLMALTTGFMLPHVFGRVISQAGMYAPWTSRGKPLIFDFIAGSATPQPRVWLDCGAFDHLLEGNRQLRELLVQKGADVTYHEYNTGHNYTAWANSLVGALEAMFPPSGR